MSDSLAHYGVLGMKWGVRKDGKPQGFQYGNGGGRGSARSRSSLSERERKRLFRSKAKLLVGAAILAGAGVAVAYGIHRKKQREYHEYMETPIDMSYYFEDPPKPRFKTVDDIPRKTKETTPEEDRKATNPGYPASGRTMNCIFCSVAYDLRRRGYDVQAKTSKMGGPANEIETYYKDAKITRHWSPDRYENFKNLKSDLEKQPVGARGSIGASGKYGGHQMSYEVRSNGVFIIDPQNGQEMGIDGLEPESVISSAYKSFDIFDYLRTDDKELNIDAINDAVDAVKHDK